LKPPLRFHPEIERFLPFSPFFFFKEPKNLSPSQKIGLLLTHRKLEIAKGCGEAASPAPFSRRRRRREGGNKRAIFNIHRRDNTARS